MSSLTVDSQNSCTHMSVYYKPVYTPHAIKPLRNLIPIVVTNPVPVVTNSVQIVVTNPVPVVINPILFVVSNDVQVPTGMLVTPCVWSVGWGGTRDFPVRRRDPSLSCSVCFFSFESENRQKRERNSSKCS